MLETIWFILWGVLWAAYFISGGFDLGLGSMMPLISRSEQQRRIVVNAMGPFWDGNEVWLIAAGGVTFAAFPATYAVMFSALYAPLMILLVCLIIRAVAFEFRSKVDSASWRKFWDVCLSVGSFLPALLLGVAFANIFMGLPIDAEGVFQGTILSLLNPYGLAGGILFVLLFLMHGAIWLAIKSKDDLEQRAARVARKLWGYVLGWTVLFLVLSWIWTKLFTNYLVYPGLFSILGLAVAGLILCRVMLDRNHWWLAWLGSSLAILGVTFFGLIGIYPALIPSSLNPAYSMTMANSASSELTLKIMLGVTLVFVPLIIGYQGWVYKTFSHKVSEEDLAMEEAY